jgi:hypothetical protein
MLHRPRERDDSRLLGLPSDARRIPLGYPASGRCPAPPRPPLETITHWERWGNQLTRTET